MMSSYQRSKAKSRRNRRLAGCSIAAATTSNSFITTRSGSLVSGMDIAETVDEKLAQMAYPVDVFVEQIEEHGLITQPVTNTDSSARKFIQRLGTATVELDAIPASEVRSLVREAIERHM